MWPDIARTYDVVAEDYAAAFADELDGKPFDRDLLDAFVREVRGPVLDVGCGPAGHLTRYLADRGVDARGIDLSPRAVALAGTRNPGLAFAVGDLRALPAPDAGVGGVAAFYSAIHLPRAELPAGFAELHRVLRPGGRLIVAMHGGEGEISAHDWFGRAVSVRLTLVSPGELAALLTGAGFAGVEVRERAPYPGEHQTPRLYGLATRPAPGP